jgi:hypothetical protein
MLLCTCYYHLKQYKQAIAVFEVRPTHIVCVCVCVCVA